MTFAGRPVTVPWLLATVGWAAQMAALSTSGFSSGRTQSFLLRLLEACDLPLSPEALEALHMFLRKSAHAALYAVLALLMYRSFAGRWTVWRPFVARGCAAAAALYGLADECHQYFVPERGASLFDWGLDASGALLAMLMVYVLTNRLARY